MGQNATLYIPVQSFNMTPSRPDWRVTLLVSACLTAISVVLMLTCGSRELSWDEADYLSSVNFDWSRLMTGYHYARHFHGPLSIYLAKLGNDFLPIWAGSFENRLRFFETLAGSLGIGFLFTTLRHSFKASIPAALAASSLLLFSVIRLTDTNVIGPHPLMLACTIAVMGLGYQWREQANTRTAVILGAAFGIGALSMTYTIPLFICWLIAVSVAGHGWISWRPLKVSRPLWVILATAVVVVAVLWPAGVFNLAFFRDFRRMVLFRPTATFVAHRIYQVTPRWAVAYWLAHLEAPLLIVSVALVAIAGWKGFKSRSLSPKHRYLGVYVLLLLAIAVISNISGARNLLLVMGALSITIGALLDEIIESKRIAQLAAVVIVALAALNLARIATDPGDEAFLGTDGYQAFLSENGSRLNEQAKLFVHGLPILNIYAEHTQTPINLELTDADWDAKPGSPWMPSGIKYILIPSIIPDYMPPGQAIRETVRDWPVVWSHQSPHSWELRLYENPHLSGKP